MISVPSTLNKGTGCYRLFMVLRDGKPRSHSELYRDLNIMVHSRASELRRKHNCLIDTWREGGLTMYQLRAVRAGKTDDGCPDSSLLGPSSVLDGSPPISAEVGATNEAGPASLPSGQDPKQGQLLIWEGMAA